MRFLQSLLYAFTGIKNALFTEKNFRIQFIVALLIIVAGFYFQINHVEWIEILFCIVLVLSLEMINSAIEQMCNFMSPGHHISIKKIKDMAAGAVLVSTIISIIIGCIIFLPKIKSLFF